jgi:hypothetical protein
MSILMDRYNRLSGWRKSWMRGEITDREALLLLWGELGPPVLKPAPKPRPRKARQPAPNER